MIRTLLCTATFALLTAFPILHAADAKKKEQPKAAAKPKPAGTKWDLMDLGPFFSSGLQVPGAPADRARPALKGVTIRLGETNAAAVCFDTERMRLAIGWTGGFLKLPTGREGLEGVPQPAAGTTVAFSSSVLPGWADKDGKFIEPKPPVKDGGELVSFGPLPKDWAHWRGLYTHGQQVILSYTVGTAEVLELPGYDATSGAFTRTFHIEGANGRLLLLVADNTVPADKELVVKVFGDVRSNVETTPEGRRQINFPGLGKSATFQVSIWTGDKTAAGAATAAKGPAKFPDLKALTKGGPAQWNPGLETKGVLGADNGPYTVDTITLPDENPWGSWLRVSGFDFFKDGTRAAICNVNGDVWIVSGLDGTLGSLKWKRFATGLFQPLGLKIRDDQVFVLGRDQLTRLVDLNGDGEADFYENFNNDVAISSHYHEFCLDLHADAQGNFYFAKGGNLGASKHPHHGCWLRIAADGRKLDVVATGLRAPNGSSVGPHGEMTVSDNEGNWVPASRVSLIKPGGFYGHVFTSHDARLAVQGTNVHYYINGKKEAEFPLDSDQFKELSKTVPVNYDQPILWLPHDYNVDNSSGGQVWVTSEKWGPFNGDLLHMSYGGCGLFKVMMEEVGGQVQGGAWKFPLRFDSGIMRGRFNAKDGQLYVCGLVVWQSNGAKKGAFHRVRYTGKPVNAPKELHIKPDGVEITFTDPLDESFAKDEQNYGVEEWNYRWTSNYGSKEFSVENPDQIKHDSITIKSVKLSPDKKKVFLEIPGLKPAMQMRVKLNLKAADGTPVNQTIWNTIHKVAAK